MHKGTISFLSIALLCGCQELNVFSLENLCLNPDFSHAYLHAYTHTRACARALNTYSVAASSGLDGYIKLWDLESGKLIKSIDGGPGTDIHDIQTSSHLSVE